MCKIHDVAAAIYHHQYEKDGGNFEFVEQRHKETVWYPMAREAIASLRPITPEGRAGEVMDNNMLDAGIKEFEKWHDPTDPGALVAAFGAMIDAALQDE